MKKTCFFLLTLFLSASMTLAANFSPIKMVITAPQMVQYNFDGSLLKIPITVSGVAGSGVLAVYTKDKAANIAKVTNGYLGWHYVNKVDTSVYISQVYEFALGNNSIQWDGKDENGQRTPPGTYTYFLFAFDSIHNKVKVNSSFNPAGYTVIEEKDEKGLQVANPMIRTPSQRWTIGNDPLDTSLLQTTAITLPTGFTRMREPNTYGGASALLPTDFNTFFLEVGNSTSVIQAIAAYTWVPNGQAILKTGWGDNGMATFSALWDSEPGVISDGKYLYTADSNHHAITADSDLYIYDFDGTLVKRIDLTTWFSNPDDAAKKGQMNGGPNFISQKNGYVFLNCHCSCIKMMVDPVAALDDEGEFVVWYNRNGDYFLDHNEQPESEKKWVCNDYIVAPEVYKFDADANGFAAALTNYIGAVSFGLMGPDGTKVGYFSYAGQSASRWKGLEQGGTMFLQNGSAFDGIYTDNLNIPDSTLVYGTWYVGHDSFKGLISKEVAVQDDAPAAFTVSQNVPNPFNPTTTISFTIPKEGMVTAEVYNVAGQRVEVLAKEHMKPGTHAIVWNASNHSAGVYFCTVRTRELSRTVKMTLMK